MFSTSTVGGFIVCPPQQGGEFIDSPYLPGLIRPRNAERAVVVVTVLLSNVRVLPSQDLFLVAGGLSHTRLLGSAVLFSFVSCA